MPKTKFQKQYSIFDSKCQDRYSGKSRGALGRFFLFLICIFGFWFFIFGFSLPVRATKIDELKSHIEQKNQEMESIQKEIDEYKDKLEKTSKDADTLNSQLKTLENTLYKIKSNVRFTQNRIEAAGLTIEELSLNIQETKEKIGENKEVISETIRLIDEADSSSLVEILLAHDNLSDFFSNLNNIEKFEKDIAMNLRSLRDLNDVLEEQKEDVAAEKNNLEVKKGELLDRQKIQQNVQWQKEVLLKQTKSKESLYKSQLQERLEKQEALENEIRAIEEELRVAIDPESLPKSGTGVLGWPVENPLITQYFGNTEFATKNPQVYSGKGHNGIDLRASIGTAVKASADGYVVDIGDTDAACKGVSYGKWVLIEHPNNLSTLYAHLSLIKVKKGDNIERSQVVGYSGNTGYVTGPHLHFTVYASKAVKIDFLKSKICGTMMKMPLAPYNAYLNPLSYL